jgi:organic radical activating enzyme
MEKISLDHATIELTRRCNMACRHCLRGDAENLDMPTKYIESFFSKVDYISSLCLTGGEPSLVPEKIMEVIRLATKHDVEINSFDITVNGKRVSNAFMVAIIELYNYCSENEMSSLSLSNDVYHDAIGNNAEKLSAFTFFTKRHFSGNGDLLNEGNAEKHGMGDRDDIIYPYEVDADNSRIQEGVAYLNCKGNITPSCDMSYENQDRPENIVCHVSEMTIEAFELFEVGEKV